MDGTSNSVSGVFADTANKTLHIDVERYQAMLDDSGVDDAQKQQVIEALWSIVVAMVELGSSVDPVSQACGKDHDLSDEFAALAEDMVDSNINEKDHNTEEPAAE